MQENITQNLDSIESSAPIVVSAFYQIADKFKNRSAQKYIDCFAFNAGLKNQFIIYCNSDEIASKIATLRAKHGLESKSLIIQKPLDSIAPNIYQSIENIFRQKGEEIPLNAMYSYLMYAKNCLVLDAIQRYNAGGGGGTSCGLILALITAVRYSQNLANLISRSHRKLAC